MKFSTTSFQFEGGVASQLVITVSGSKLAVAQRDAKGAITSSKGGALPARSTKTVSSQSRDRTCNSPNPSSGPGRCALPVVRSQ